jgi:hypothetical protein
MWSTECVSVGLKELGPWLGFRVRCKGIGKLSVCLHGHWNMGVYGDDVTVAPGRTLTQQL